MDTDKPDSPTDYFSAALDHLDSRAASVEALAGIRAEWNAARKSRNGRRFLKAQIRLAHGLYSAGRVSEPEFFYFLAMPLIHEFETRWLNGDYQKDLVQISNRIDEIEKEHGLSDDEAWGIGEGPEEHTRLTDQYDSILDHKTEAVFREFGENLLAELWKSDRETFDSLFEQGRAAIFEKDDRSSGLAELASQYQREAEQAAKQRLSYAACALWGAALEARLLAEALARSKAVAKTVASLDRQTRPKSNDPMRWSLMDLLVVAARSGWLPAVPGKFATHLPEGWAHHLRALRNLLHPARHILDRPRALIGDSAVADARAAFVLVNSQLDNLPPEAATVSGRGSAGNAHD